MDEKRAITAISDAPFESLVAKTLYENGWSVEKRVIEVGSLDSVESDLLVLSLDIEGLTQEKLDQLISTQKRIIIFLPNPHGFKVDISALHQPTKDPLALLSILRGSSRSPLIHKSSYVKTRNKSELFVIASSYPHVGGSFLAAQIAFEMSLNQKKVLLVDGDLEKPSAYFHLGVRDLSEPQGLTPFLSAVDLSTRERDEHLSLLGQWLSSFDFMIFDAGVLSSLTTLEKDRRHEGQLLTWVLDRSSKRVVVTTGGELEMRAHSKAMLGLKEFKPQGKFLEIMNKVERSNKAPENCYYLPRDDRAVSKCAKEKLLMNEGAPRSPLSKAIAQFVREGLM